jgi:hypothetical protein
MDLGMSQWLGRFGVLCAKIYQIVLALRLLSLICLFGDDPPFRLKSNRKKVDLTTAARSYFISTEVVAAPPP